MKFYLCACSLCSWRGNKIHFDGQCPVCGHGLDVTLFGHRSHLVTRSGLTIRGLSIGPTSAELALERLRRLGLGRRSEVE